jgi:hypothetical protein
MSFHGETLLMGQDDAIADGAVVLPFKRLCDAIGVNYKSQERRLRGACWATIHYLWTVASDGKSRRTTCIDLDTLAGWLMTINTNDVRNAAARPRPVLFQKDVIRVVLMDEPTEWRAYFCTDPSASVVDVLMTVADRFSLEITFRDVKEMIGAGKQQVRLIWANVGVSHVCLGTFTMTEAWA